MPKVQPLVSLGAVPSETRERVWIMPFGLTFDRAILDPSTMTYELDVDTAPTFASVNARHLTSTGAGLSAFQNGAIGKAFEVELPGRSTQDVTWYWRVRVNNGVFLSDWSDTRTFTVPSRDSVTNTGSIFNRLADENSYAKEANSANVYKLLLQAGRELDQLLLEKDRTITDLVLDTARDTALNDNFARLLALDRVATEAAAHHRWKTKKLWKAFINYPGTEQGMIDAIVAFVAEPPTILDLTATEGWILDENFIKVPTHPEIQPIIVLYGRPQKGHSWVLKIWNSWGLTYDQNTLEKFINKMKPAHSELTISYATSRHWGLRYNRQADWDLWTNSGNIDTTTNAGTIRLNVGATTGTLTSPVERIATNSAFEAPELITWPAGQTITVEIRTSSDGTTFGSWITLQHGVNPDSSLTILPYMQMRVTLSRTSAGAPNPVLESLQVNGTRT